MAMCIVGVFVFSCSGHCFACVGNVLIGTKLRRYVQGAVKRCCTVTQARLSRLEVSNESTDRLFRRYRDAYVYRMLLVGGKQLRICYRFPANEFRISVGAG